MPCVSYNEEQLFKDSIVPRSIMKNMNYFEYQYDQASNMPKGTSINDVPILDR